MRVLRLVLLAAVVALLGVSSGCTSDAAPNPVIGAADAYVAIVVWQIGQQGPPSTAANLPVIYLAASNGKSIDAGVQAKVAKQTVDRAKVRFADTVEDATDTKVDGAPVRDDAVLLIVDPLDDPARSQIQLPVTVYRSTTDSARYRLTLVAADAGVSVTAAQPMPAD